VITVRQVPLEALPVGFPTENCYIPAQAATLPPMCVSACTVPRTQLLQRASTYFLFACRISGRPERSCIRFSEYNNGRVATHFLIKIFKNIVRIIGATPTEAISKRVYLHFLENEKVPQKTL